MVDSTSHAQPALVAVPYAPWATSGVRVSGELDLCTAEVLAGAVAAAYAAVIAAPASTGVFLLDLRGLTFLDARGSLALATVRAQTQSRGDRLQVAFPIALSPQRVLAFGVACGWLTSEFARTQGPTLDRRRPVVDGRHGWGVASARHRPHALPALRCLPSGTPPAAPPPGS